MRVRGDLADEVVQETALRGLAAEFESQRHLVAWSVVVGKRLVYDESRRRARARAAERRLRIDDYREPVEELVAARLKQESMREVIGRLPEHKRAALADRTSRAVDPRESGRIAVARHRVRADLRRVFDRLGVAVGGWRARLGFRSGQAAEAGNSTATVIGIAFAALGAGTLAVTLAIPNVPDDPSAGKSAPSHSAVFERSPAWAEADLPTAAATVSTAPTRKAAVAKVDLGQDLAGNPRSVQARPQAPEESGVMYCTGEPDEPGFRCLYWPKVVRQVGDGVVPPH